MLKHMYPKIDEQMWAHWYVRRTTRTPAKIHGRMQSHRKWGDWRNKSKESLKQNSLSDSLLFAMWYLCSRCVWVFISCLCRVLLCLCSAIEFVFSNSCDSGMHVGCSRVLIVPVIDIVCPMEMIAASITLTGQNRIQQQVKQIKQLDETAFTECTIV